MNNYGMRDEQEKCFALQKGHLEHDHLKTWSEGGTRGRPTKPKVEHKSVRYTKLKNSDNNVGVARRFLLQMIFNCSIFYGNHCSNLDGNAQPLN